MNDKLVERFENNPAVTIASFEPASYLTGWQELIGISGTPGEWELYIAGIAYTNPVWVQLTDNEPRVYFWPLALVW
jgi:hypothetical protein